MVFTINTVDPGLVPVKIEVKRDLGILFVWAWRTVRHSDPNILWGKISFGSRRIDFPKPTRQNYARTLKQLDGHAKPR